MSDRHSINSKQLLVYIMSAQIGVGIITLASQLAKDVGHDGWIPILMAGLVTVVFMVLLMLLMKRYSDKSIFEINRFLFGKLPGGLINILLTLYLTFATGMILRAFTDFTCMLVLPSTPPVILACLLILPTLYLTWYGLQAVVKFSYVLFLSLSVILFLAVLTHDELRMTFLMPVGEAGIDALIKEIPTIIYSILGFELFVYIYPQIVDKTRAMKWAITAILYTVFFYVFVFILSVSLVGEQRLALLTAPLFNLARYYRQILFERVGFFFILLWLPFLESSLRIHFFTVYYNFNQLFSFKNKGLFTFIFAITVILISRIPKDPVQFFNILRVDSIIGISVVGFFLLCYLFSFINKRGIN